MAFSPLKLYYLPNSFTIWLRQRLWQELETTSSNLIYKNSDLKFPGENLKHMLIGGENLKRTSWTRVEPATQWLTADRAMSRTR